MLRRISVLLLVSVSVLTFVSISNAETAAFRSQHVSFHVDSRPDGFTRVYYSCSSVESQLESFLKELGAQNINVRCTGGINTHLPDYAWESDVELQFDALTLVAPGTSGAIHSSFRDVSVREWDGCYLLKQTFQEVEPNFVFKNVNGPNACSSSSGAFRLELMALFP